MTKIIIDDGDIWTTNVLVSDTDPKIWYTMNRDIDKIDMIEGTHIEQWVFVRTDYGDELIEKKD